MSAPRDEARILSVGLYTLVLGLGGFLLWASLAKLDEGVPAPAVVSVDTQRKAIQHPSIATVRKVLVKEDQEVKAGDVLLELDDADSRTNYETLQEDWRGAQAQLDGKLAQQKLLLEQLKGTRELARDGFLARNKLYEEERAAADLAASISALSATVAKHKRSMSAASTEMSRSLLRAPVSGRVVGLTAQTVGGVVAAGAKIMEIVPRDEQLVLEAQVPPHLVDRLRPGMPADIRFSGFNDLPNLFVDGRLLSVSADRFTDPATRAPYFLARVEVAPEGLKKLGERRIQAGMSAVVILKTGSRTMLAYLLTPLLRRVSTSFVER